MELIRTLREKHQTAKEHEISLQAEERIGLEDFDNTLYISFDGVPLMPIKESWTTKEIIQQLTIFRNSYINSKIR